MNPILTNFPKGPGDSQDGSPCQRQKQQQRQQCFAQLIHKWMRDEEYLLRQHFKHWISIKCLFPKHPHRMHWHQREFSWEINCQWQLFKKDVYQEACRSILFIFNTILKLSTFMVTRWKVHLKMKYWILSLHTVYLDVGFCLCVKNYMRKKYLQISQGKKKKHKEMSSTVFVGNASYKPPSQVL